VERNSRQVRRCFVRNVYKSGRDSASYMRSVGQYLILLYFHSTFRLTFRLSHCHFTCLSLVDLTLFISFLFPHGSAILNLH